MIIATMLGALSILQAAPDCRRADPAMLSLDLQAFDQSDAGWRALDVEGCETAAADAIETYRAVNREALAGEFISMLLWHEGQLRAAAGQTDRAIDLMSRSGEENMDTFRAYIDATVAFLRKDRPAIEAARVRLLAIPEPDYYRQNAERFAERYPDRPKPVWPPNLRVIDGLIACFNKPYAEAYGCAAERQ